MPYKYKIIRVYILAAILVFVLYVIGMFTVMGFGYSIGHIFGKNVSPRDTWVDDSATWIMALAGLALLIGVFYRFRKFELTFARVVILDLRMTAKLLDKNISRVRGVRLTSR